MKKLLLGLGLACLIAIGLVVPTATQNAALIFGSSSGTAVPLSVTAGGVVNVTTTAVTTTGDVTAGSANGLCFTSRGCIKATADGVFNLLNTAGTGFTRLMLGGSTASFPALKVNGAAIDFRLADDSNYASVTVNGLTVQGNTSAGSVAVSNIKMGGGGPILISSTAPTISSGFGTGATIASSNGASSFTINVGTTSATTGVIGLPAATTGWNVTCLDITTFSTTMFLTRQTASTTTTATIGGFTNAAVAQAWTNSDILRCTALAY